VPHTKTIDFMSSERKLAMRSNNFQRSNVCTVSTVSNMYTLPIRDHKSHNKQQRKTSLSTMVKSFILKDSPSELIATSQVSPKGRAYSKEFSEKPGAVQIDEVVLGTKLACVAITDDEEGTLAKVGKTMPWHIEALTVITGSEEAAHKPLSTILSTHFDLKLDKTIDISGFAGRFFLDTQGYIAHNDETIVLAFRCTTSAFDWMTNFTTTTSEWEPEIDIPQGHSGHFSCMSGLCCEDEYKPRVHTGFYNNFLATAPLIKKYIDPLLASDQPPRKLFVVGHSLGAGIANMATCYFLLHHDWAQLPHKLVCVTAGSPRSVQGSMRDLIQEEMQKLRPLGKAVICRVVRDKDVVATLPPAMLGFAHLDKLVYITKSGEVLINPVFDESHMITEKELKKLKLYDVNDDDVTEATEGNTSGLEARDVEETKETEPVKSKYERKVNLIPRVVRDHMPDFYLKPLIALLEKEHPAEKPNVGKVAESQADVKQVGVHRKKKRFQFFRRRTKPSQVSQQE
jgi:hypothetical protein